MKEEQARQYTIRSVPAAVDRALRQQAKAEGKSLNEVAREALRRGAGLHEEPAVFTDLDDCTGTWREDPDFEKALREQDTVDRKLWR
jgi:plasmid stability protein